MGVGNGAGWYQWLSTMEDRKIEFDVWASTPPIACPECGEPLQSAPGGAEGTLFCKFDGWEFPRDWQRPVMN